MRLVRTTGLGGLLVAFVMAATAGAASAYGGGGTSGPPSAPQGSLGNGNGVILQLGSQTVLPGGTDSVSSATGACSPNTVVTLYLLHVVPGQAEIPLGTTTANAAGGFPSTAFTVPTGSSPGGYVVIATCSSPNGEQVETGPFVVLPVAGAASAAAASSVPAVFASEHPAGSPPWTAPVGSTTPALAAVTARAVNASIAGLVDVVHVTQAPPGIGPGSAATPAALVSTGSGDGSSSMPELSVLAALLLLAATGGVGVAARSQMRTSQMRMSR